MTDTATTHATIQTYWASADARDWTTFATTLADNVIYELPQTRERIRGKTDYIQFNAEYPGDWRIATTRIIAAAGEASTWLEVTAAGTTTPAVTYFRIDDGGLIAHITEFWPEPYEPPAGREHLTERW